MYLFIQGYQPRGNIFFFLNRCSSKVGNLIRSCRDHFFAQGRFVQSWQPPKKILICVRPSLPTPDEVHWVFFCPRPAHPGIATPTEPIFFKICVRLGLATPDEHKILEKKKKLCSFGVANLGRATQLFFQKNLNVSQMSQIFKHSI